MVKRVMVAALTLAAASSAAAQGTAEGAGRSLSGLAQPRPSAGSTTKEARDGPQPADAGAGTRLIGHLQHRICHAGGRRYAVTPQLGVTGSFPTRVRMLKVSRWAMSRARPAFAVRRLPGLGNRRRHPLALRAQCGDQSVCWRRGRLSSDRFDARDVDRAGGRRRPRGHAVL